MDSDRNPQAMRLFEQLADLPPSQRAAKLDELCAGDAALRALVEAMLAADAQADEPFSGNGAQWSDALGADSAVEAADQSQPILLKRQKTSPEPPKISASAKG